MGFADEDILVIGDAVRRPRFTIRGLMILNLAVAAVAWAMRQPGSNEFLLKHWPLIALALPPLYGLVWSIRRVYRVTPERKISRPDRLGAGPALRSGRIVCEARPVLCL